MRKILNVLLLFCLALGACAPDAAPAAIPAVPKAAWPDAPEIASYDIQVTLDAEAKTLRGRETITYRNTTLTPIPDIVLHLYLNAFRSQDSRFLQEAGVSHRGFAWDPEHPGSLEITGIHLPDGTPLVLEPLEDGTLARAGLPQAVAPGGELALTVDFEARLPKVFARTGFYEDFFMVGQWFPKLGVWQDAGWNAYPFHANAEFFADFGSYRVAITLPESYVTGGTGLPAGTLAQGNGQKTEIYQAHGVIDFAWTASPHFKQASRDVNGVQVLYLYLPEHEHTVKRALDAATKAVQHFGEWYGPYPYARLTVVDVPDGAGGAGGMEYPTLISAGAIDPTGLNLMDGRFDRMLEVVVIHEIGHQWWQSMVAFNEAEEPWLDEGFTDYSTARLMQRAYGPASLIDAGNVKVSYIDMHRMIYLASPQVPMYGRAWEFDAFNGYEVATYSKPVLALSTLENILGEETMLAIMSTFFARYRFAHPTTQDFYRVAEEISGRELDWFFDGLVYGDGVVNYTVTAVDAHQVTVERQGELAIPVEIAVDFRDGSTQILHWDGRETQKTWDFPDAVVIAAQVDPQRKVLVDVQWSDNGLATRMDAWSWLAVNTRLFYQLQNWLFYLGGL
ncbi:MAG: M1 family metallopeptidase [Chloroflexota bacterium]